MMATNTLPDLITLGFGDPLASELIEGGYVWDLDELMDEYCPEFKDEVPKTLRVIGTYEEYDNKFYSLTGVSNSDAVFETYMADPTNQAELNIIVGNFSYSVRKDIWEEMGEPSIATPDDLYNVLKQFKEKYPTLNGKTSIGISGYATGSTTDYLTSSGLLKTMGYSFGIMDYYLPGDGTCTTKYLNPNYPEFIAYMNKLYTEGLIDPEVFVKDDQQVVEDLSTCSFMMPYVWHAADPANNLLDAVDPNSHFISIPPMAAEGEEFAFPVSRVGGAVMTFVSKSTDDPEACIKLLRYGFSPTGTLQTSKGNPGEHYWVQDGILTNSPEVVEAYKVDAAGYNNEAGLWDYYSMWYPPIFEKRTDSADRVKYDYPNSLPFAFDGTATAYKMDPSTTSDEGIAKATIENIIKRSEAAAITAATPEESAAIIEAMIQEIVATKDFDKLESYWTARYQKNLELFGEPWF